MLSNEVLTNILCRPNLQQRLFFQSRQTASFYASHCSCLKHISLNASNNQFCNKELTHIWFCFRKNTSRAVVMLLKVRGPNLLKPFWALLAWKSGRAQVCFYYCMAKKVGGPRPPGPLILTTALCKYPGHVRMSNKKSTFLTII